MKLFIQMYAIAIRCFC